MKKNYRKLLIVPLFLLALTACGADKASSDDELNQDIDFDTSSLEINTEADIVFSATAISSSNSSVFIDGNIVTIDNGGEYTISGVLEDGQLVIDAKGEDVNIILDNVAITNSRGPAIYVAQAQDVLISLVEGSINILADGDDYDTQDDALNATIFSKDDLKLVGSEGATLQIIGNYKDAIVSKDDLDIFELELIIDAKDDGLRGKDSVEISGSKIVINAGGDAIKADNENEDKGYVMIKDSVLTINAGDDGIHADNLVEIFSGDIDIQDSFEGLEAKVITIHDGDVSITASDDGLNVSASVEGYKGEDIIPEAIVNIFGGVVTLNTGGDGFDSNGSALMTGGTLIINGPTEDRNGYIDVNGSFDISGGTLIAIGSVGMAETPSETSSQKSIQVNFDQDYPATTKLSLVDSQGSEIFSYTAIKTFASLTYSSANLVVGETYDVRVDNEIFATVTIDGTITKYGEIVQSSRRGR